MHTWPPKLVQNQPGKRKFYIGVSVRENYFTRDFIANVALGTDIANKKIVLLRRAPNLGGILPPMDGKWLTSTATVTMDEAHGYEQPRALRKWRRHHWIQ